MADKPNVWEVLGLPEPTPKESAEPQPFAAEVGARVAKARKSRGLTGTQLGEMTGLRKDQISKIESGRRRLGLVELSSFAEALGVTVRHLLGTEERPSLAIAARLAAPAAPEAMAEARRRARQLFEIEDLLTEVAHMPPARPSERGERVIAEARSAYSAVPRSKADAQRQGRQLADLARRELDLGGDALGDLAGLIEQHFAVDVALSPLGAKTDGLCVHSGSAALILASTDFPDGHVRFTLAHELAHHLLGDPREIIEESEGDMFAETAAEWRVNSFAGHFLMPEPGIRSVLDWLGEEPGSISNRAVVALMEHFGVSMAALIYQLNIIGVMSYAAGQQVRSRGVASLVELYREAAPSGASSNVGRARRPPERLVRNALAAAQQQLLGLAVVASVLEREDDEQLWREVMQDRFVTTERSDIEL